MSEDPLYWIWIQNALGFGSAKLKNILSRFRSIVDFYERGLDFWFSLSVFSKKELLKLSEPIEHFSNIVERCKLLGYEIITFSSNQYPFLLKQISNPPAVIYAKGDVSLLNSKCVSIVGSRRASMYGMQMSFDIAHDLSEHGVTVVSGGALGTDSAAHKGALSAHGNTICVVACGIDYPYLIQNEFLRNKISNSGLLISEYPPSYPIQSYNFPVRNRIISGMSFCTVIVEAGKRSGSLLTANCAADQGRDVFVVPVKFESRLSQGVNDLIADGAKVITSANDILNFIASVNHDNINPSENLHNPSHSVNKITLSDEERKVYEALSSKKTHIDDIVRKTKVPIQRVSSILVKLELFRLVFSHRGRFYTS